MRELQQRKTTRLVGADYHTTGIFFLTICTKNKQCLLSHMVGTGVLDGPHIELTHCGKIADKYLNQLNDFYNDISIEDYVIMPNHIHLILRVNDLENGPSRMPAPTLQNSTVSRFISTFKSFCNKECGENIWQYRSYDHIIRNLQDYETHIKYIRKSAVLGSRSLI